jgi:hypothetical protein
MKKLILFVAIITSNIAVSQITPTFNKFKVIVQEVPFKNEVRLRRVFFDLFRINNLFKLK